MKYILIILFLFLCIGSADSFAQNAIAKIKYEQAEEAYIKSDFSTTITRLDEAEKLLGSSNPKILYLRIMAEKGIISAGKYDYDFLTSVRYNAAFYIKNYSEVEGIEGKFREVYDFSETLEKLPITKELFKLKAEKIARVINVCDSLMKAFKVRNFSTVEEFRAYNEGAFAGLSKSTIPNFVASYGKGDYSANGPFSIIFNEKGLLAYGFILQGLTNEDSAKKIYHSYVDLFPAILDKEYAERKEINKDAYGNELGSLAIGKSGTSNNGTINIGYYKIPDGQAFVLLVFGFQ